MKRYKDPKKYQKDAVKMAKQSWYVVNVTEFQPRRSFGGFLFLGLWQPKPELVVTYKKEGK